MAGLEPRRNMPAEDFLRLLLGSRCLVGNSSAGIRECAYLGVPAVNIGNRQQGRLRGANVVDVPHDPVIIAGELRRLAVMMTGQRYPSTNLYGDGRAGDRVAGVILQALGVEDRGLPGDRPLGLREEAHA